MVRVWGPRALEVADAVFRPSGGLGWLGPSRSAEGRPDRGGLGDEVVAVVSRASRPRWRSTATAARAGGAGGRGAVAAGAERRQPVAWVRHAARSRIAAEAEVDLARAPTVRTAEILLDQAQGALKRTPAG